MNAQVLRRLAVRRRLPPNVLRQMALATALLVGGADGLGAQVSPVSEGTECEGVDPSLHLRGSVRDLLTRAGMPGANVTLRSDRFGGVLLGIAQSDVTGRFRFCGVPPIPGLTLEAEVEGKKSGVVEIPDPPVGEVAPLYIEWTRPVDIAGIVVDGVSGEPLPGVVVTLPAHGSRSTTNDDGDFRIQGQGAGRLVLETSLLGYATRVDTLDTTSGDLLDLTVRLSTQPIALEPLEVRVRATRVSEARRVGSRFDEITRDEIDAILPRAVDFEGLLRAARFPGVTVRMTPDGSLCIAQMRRAGGCAMAEVYLNGVRVVDSGMLLTALDPGSIESMQFLDPLEAWTRFIGPNVRNGVLVIQTRSGRRPGPGAP